MRTFILKFNYKLIEVLFIPHYPSHSPWFDDLHSLAASGLLAFPFSDQCLQYPGSGMKKQIPVL